jgi:hypothetical protein
MTFEALRKISPLEAWENVPNEDKENKANEMSLCLLEDVKEFCLDKAQVKEAIEELKLSLVTALLLRTDDEIEQLENCLDLYKQELGLVK